MQFIKVKFLKNGIPQGRSYTYKSEEELFHGDMADLGDGKQGVVVDEPVDLDWVEMFGADKIKSIVRKVEGAEND